MAEYIVQKPVDMKNLTAKARKSLPTLFDITPKYDGCCAVLAFTKDGYVGAYSATGELAPSMDIIGREIERSGALKGLQIALVGEAWIPNADFPTINGTFRRKREQETLRFAPFDSTFFEPGDEFPILGSPLPLGQRVRVLDGLKYGDRLVHVPRAIGPLDEAERMALSYKAMGGFDGAIARDPYAPYIVGRSKAEVIKVKPTLSLDLAVISWKVEPGVKTGRSVLTIEVGLNGTTCWVGSGVPHDLYGADLVGKIVEIEFMGYTPDGKLREPRFKGIRYDKTGPDA